MRKNDRWAACARIIEKVSRMTPENKQLFLQAAEELHHKSLKQRLRQQPLLGGICFEELRDYIKKEQAADCDEVLLFMDIFSYGVIYGTRQERARRSRKDISDVGLLVSPSEL